MSLPTLGYYAKIEEILEQEERLRARTEKLDTLDAAYENGDEACADGASGGVNKAKLTYNSPL